MLERRIKDNLKRWLEEGRDACLVTGARQIGKTFLIRELLRENGDYVEINFIERPELIDVFKSADSVKNLLMRISVAAGKPLIPGETVVFFDEVQQLPDIVTWIKFLVEEGSYRYILSGSLLGVELTDLRSVPVGYLQVQEMFPLDLFEFFNALEIQSETIRLIHTSFQKRQPIDEYVHKKLLDVFYLYLIIGGMPEAVQTYVDTNDIAQVSQIHEKILRLYKMDFSQYEGRNKLRLREIYDAIPGELEEKNKRFFINHVAGKLQFDRVKNDFLWLKNAGVALPVYNVQELRKPLKISEKRNLFKLFFSDVGLLTSQYPSKTKLQLLSQAPGINNGGLFENAIAQELTAKGIPGYYYNSKKQGELDFVIELDGEILPIEVKSGKDYKKHSALNNVMKTPSYPIREGIVFYNGNIRKEGKILYLPIYMVACLKNQVPDKLIYKPDLSGL